MTAAAREARQSQTALGRAREVATREPWRSLLLALLVASLATYSRTFSGLTVPNERSRLYLAIAVVDHGSFAVDEVVARFGPTLDLASYGGHHYSDKAPGASLIGVVVYGLLRLVSDAETWSLCDLLEAVRFAGILPLSLGGFFVFRRLLRDRGTAAGVIDAVSLAWLMASPAFHYSAAFYGHQVVAVLALTAFFCIRRCEEYTPHGPPQWVFALLGGSCIGLTLLSEYQAALLAAALAIYAFSGPMRRAPRILAAMLAPMALGIAALLGYDAVCFGGPLELSYHHLADASLRRIHERGVGGVTLPSTEALLGTTLSLHRGLLATCPWVLAAIIGGLVLWRRGARRETALLAGTSLAFVLFASSSNMWVAGWSYGPRLLVPVMGFMALLVAPALPVLATSRFGSALVRGLMVAALLGYQTVRVTFAELPPEATNPLADVALPAMLRGLLAPSIPSSLGWTSAVATLLPWSLLVLSAAGVLLLAPWQRPAETCPAPAGEPGGEATPAGAAAEPGSERCSAGAPGSVRPTWRSTLLASACAIGFVWIVVASGLGWSSAERDRFLAFFERLALHEYSDNPCQPL